MPAAAGTHIEVRQEPGLGVRILYQTASFTHPSAAFLWTQKMSPCMDGSVVAAREGDPVDLVDAEQADPAMFFTDAKITLVASAQAVGDDHHFSLWEHLVDPTVEESPDLDSDPELLANFPREAAFRGLPGLEPPSRQFPLSALILQQNNLAALVEDALY
jgi:hypothetical protein